MLAHCQNLLEFWEPVVCSVLFIIAGIVYEGRNKWIRWDKIGILFSAWIQITVLACLGKLVMVKLFAWLADFCKTDVEQPSLPPPNASPPANPPPNAPPPANPPPNAPPPANPPPNAPPPANPPPNCPPPVNPPPDVPTPQPTPVQAPPIQPIPCPFCGHVHQRNCTNATRQQREG